MLNLPIYGDKKLITAFEYGMTLAISAQDLKIELTPEIVKRVEDFILQEFKTKHWKQLNMEMAPNLLASFEP